MAWAASSQQQVPGLEKIIFTFAQAIWAKKEMVKIWFFVFNLNNSIIQQLIMRAQIPCRMQMMTISATTRLIDQNRSFELGSGFGVRGS